MFCGTSAKTYLEHGDRVYMDLWGRACFEIDDSEAEIKLTDAELKDPNRTFRFLGDVLHHPKLFEAYPDLSDAMIFMHQHQDRQDRTEARAEVTVASKHRKQWIRHTGGYISTYKTGAAGHDRLLSSILHETQHLIDLRDFERGMNGPWMEESYNPHSMKFTPTGLRTAADELKIQMRTYPDETRYSDELLAILQRDLDKMLPSWVDDFKNCEQGTYRDTPRNWERHPELPPVFDEYSRRHALLIAVANETQGLDIIWQERFGKNIQYYLLPTETIARDVQARHNLTSDERLAIRPYNAATWPPGTIGTQTKAEPAPSIGPTGDLSKLSPPKGIFPSEASHNKPTTARQPAKPPTFH